jgi:tetratricopeptide (TPR) repeat protein
MFNNKIRLVLIIVSILYGSQALSKGNLWGTVLSFTSTGLLIYGYFRYHQVFLLHRYIQQGDLAKAQEIADSIRFPNLLSTQQKAYYLFAKGYLAINDSRNELAIDYFLQSLETGLRTTNDMAVANLELAKIYQAQGNRAKALERLQQARELPHKNELDPIIEELAATF